MRNQLLSCAKVTVGLILLSAAMRANRNPSSQRNTDSGSVTIQPVLGYLVQSWPVELRAILGIPGSARFSEPLPLSKSVKRIHLAPGQPYAIVERRDDVPAVLRLDASAAGQPVPMPEALPVADLVAFSPTGKSALLYSTEPCHLQVITGLPTAPHITQDLDAATLQRRPTSMAVSDDASTILLAFDGSVAALLPGGRIQEILTVAASVAFAFFPNSTNAAIADRGGDTLYRVQNFTGTMSAMFIAGGLENMGEIIATADGKALLVTNAESQSIWLVDAHSGEVHAINIGVHPTRMERLGITNMFLVAAEPGEPGWIITREGNSIRTSFVPAVLLSPRHNVPREGGTR